MTIEHFDKNKLPSIKEIKKLDRRLGKLAAKRHMTKAAIIREALQRYAFTEILGRKTTLNEATKPVKDPNAS